MIVRGGQKDCREEKDVGGIVKGNGFIAQKSLLDGKGKDTL